MARILVVDDEPNIRKMVALALSRAGHDVQTAEDGRSALALFGDGTAWDAFLVDERMEGMPGRDVIGEAARIDPSARLVMMTSFDTADLASTVVQRGATDFLAKPFTADMLRRALVSVLARPRRPFVAGPGGDAAGAPAEGGHAVSYWVNGYGYLGAPLPPRSDIPVPPAITVLRAFRVTGPLDEEALCVAAVMPHVEDQVAALTGRPVPPDDPVWDMVCQFALRGYLWKANAMPPAVLTVYDLTAEELEDLRRASS